MEIAIPQPASSGWPFHDMGHQLVTAGVMCDDVVEKGNAVDYVGVRYMFELPPEGKLALQGYLALRFHGTTSRPPSRLGETVTVQLFGPDGPHMMPPAWLFHISFSRPDEPPHWHKSLKGYVLSKPGWYRWEIKINHVLASLVVFGLYPPHR